MNYSTKCICWCYVPLIVSATLCSYLDATTDISYRPNGPLIQFCWASLPIIISAAVLTYCITKHTYFRKKSRWIPWVYPIGLFPAFLAMGVLVTWFLFRYGPGHYVEAYRNQELMPKEWLSCTSSNECRIADIACGFSPGLRVAINSQHYADAITVLCSKVSPPGYGQCPPPCLGQAYWTRNWPPQSLPLSVCQSGRCLIQ